MEVEKVEGRERVKIVINLLTSCTQTYLLGCGTPVPEWGGSELDSES